MACMGIFLSQFSTHGHTFTKRLNNSLSNLLNGISPLPVASAVLVGAVKALAADGAADAEGLAKRPANGLEGAPKRQDKRV